MPRQSVVYSVRFKGPRGGALRSISKAFAFDVYYGRKLILKNQGFGRLRSKFSREEFVEKLIQKIERKRRREMRVRQQEREARRLAEEKARKAQQKAREVKKKLKQAEKSRYQFQKMLEDKITKEQAIRHADELKERFLQGQHEMVQIKKDLFMPYDQSPDPDSLLEGYDDKTKETIFSIGNRMRPRTVDSDRSLVRIAKSIAKTLDPKNIGPERVSRQRELYQLETIDMPDFSSVYEVELNNFEKNASFKLGLIVPFKPKNDVWSKDYIYKYRLGSRGKYPVCIYSFTLEQKFHIPVTMQTYFISFNEFIDRIGVYVRAFFMEQEGRFDKWIFRIRFARKVSETQWVEQGVSLDRREAKTWEEFKLIVIATYLKLRGVDRPISPTGNYLMGNSIIKIIGFSIEAI